MKKDLHGQEFHPVFEPGSGRAPPLLLLHGTGGNERDLIPLARQLSPDSPLLSVRGRVRENGMARFFRRFAEGVFDVEDLHRRTSELLDYLGEAVAIHGIEMGRLVILGYSNGANMGTSLLLSGPRYFAGGILFRPMVIHELENPLPDLSGKRILLLGGRDDPIGPPPEVGALAKQYASTGAAVHTVIHEGASHGLVQEDLDEARRFMRNFRHEKS